MTTDAIDTRVRISVPITVTFKVDNQADAEQRAAALCDLLPAAVQGVSQSHPPVVSGPFTQVND